MRCATCQMTARWWVCASGACTTMCSLSQMAALAFACVACGLRRLLQFPCQAGCSLKDILPFHALLADWHGSKLAKTDASVHALCLQRQSPKAAQGLCAPTCNSCTQSAQSCIVTRCKNSSRGTEKGCRRPPAAAAAWIAGKHMCNQAWEKVVKGKLCSSQARAQCQGKRRLMRPSLR